MTRSDDSPTASDEKEVETEGLRDEAQVTAEAPETDSAEVAAEVEEGTESGSAATEFEMDAETATDEGESETGSLDAADAETDSTDEPEPEPEAPQRARMPALRTPEPEPEPEPAAASRESDTADDEDFVPTRRGRGGYDPEADAAARVARYTFRQRAVLGLVLSTLILAAAGFAVTAALWWLAALSGAGLVGYLAYLRRQVRLEEDIRRRRAARAARKRTEDAEEPPATRERPRPDREQTRTQLRRAVLVESDDEDPLFEHLELFDAAAARATRQRATGGREYRAVGE